MTGKIIHEKAGELLARITEWNRTPLRGMNESDPMVMQAQALAFIAEALALIAAERSSQDEPSDSKRATPPFEPSHSAPK